MALGPPHSRHHEEIIRLDPFRRGNMRQNLNEFDCVWMHIGFFDYFKGGGREVKLKNVYRIVGVIDTINEGVFSTYPSSPSRYLSISLFHFHSTLTFPPFSVHLQQLTHHLPHSTFSPTPLPLLPILISTTPPLLDPDFISRLHLSQPSTSTSFYPPLYLHLHLLPSTTIPPPPPPLQPCIHPPLTGSTPNLPPLRCH